MLDPKRNLLTISAVLPAWATVAPQRGEKVINIECQPQKYIVIAKDSSDEERWLANSTLKNALEKRADDAIRGPQVLQSPKKIAPNSPTI
ncbi:MULTISPECIES: hypothetical protein [unclassified Anabaena]|uniref:hypothetical protein n=1 Tax=unclassified Anabaena TaxID=2619674 RepID=UPI0039C67E64